MMRILPLSVLLGLIPAPALAEPFQAISPQAIADRLVGVLVYRTDEFEIHMSTCPATYQGATENEIYLYQEQARQDRLDQPYRQRLLKITAPSEERVTSDSYKLTAASQWVGFCREAHQTRKFEPADVRASHCTVTLVQQGLDFIGTTPEPGCPSNFRGATYVRNRVILSVDGMKTYDQGVDADGNRVWGAEDEPYIFEKIKTPET